MTREEAWSEGERQRLTQALIEHAPTGPNTEPHLARLIQDAASVPGKLLRARLLLATVTAHGGDDGAAMLLGTAVEYFHVASLLLDDLPCMDDAQTRRGKTCSHHVHGEATTILGALAFINRAYSLIGCALSAQPPRLRLALQACLDACLGTAGLVGGQARDLRFAAGDRSAREVGRVALGKTGAMFELSLMFPALFALPNPNEARALHALCVYWGLVFQVVDDLQDVLSTSVAAGKSVGHDRALARPNLAVVLGVPATRQRVRRLLGQADRCVEKLRRERVAWSYLIEWQRYLVASAAPLVGSPAEIAA
jgi:geranylgeranyl diphosphate synthase type II